MAHAFEANMGRLGSELGFFAGVLAKVPDRPGRYGVRHADGLALGKEFPCLFKGRSIISSKPYAASLHLHAWQCCFVFFI